MKSGAQLAAGKCIGAPIRKPTTPYAPLDWRLCRLEGRPCRTPFALRGEVASSDEEATDAAPGDDDSMGVVEPMPATAESVSSGVVSTGMATGIGAGPCKETGCIVPLLRGMGMVST
jgi:hypothetical protein